MSKQDYRELEAYRALGKPEELCKKQGWISVKDRLPPDGRRVLVYFTDCVTDALNIAIARHTEDGWRAGRVCPGEVHFWMPLPTAPKEDNDG